MLGFKITEIAKKRILILDGPMGTMIQNEKLTEKKLRSQKRPF